MILGRHREDGIMVIWPVGHLRGTNTWLARLVFILCTLIPSVAMAETKNIEIWIRSFIPNVHDSKPGYVRPVPKKPSLTMISGPIPTVSDCFLTDQRWFSSDVKASARIGARVIIAIGTPPKITFSEHLASESVEVDCEDGDEECRKAVDTSRSKVGPVTRQGNTVRLSVHGRANNACFAGSPDIHYKGDFIVDLTAGTVKFEGIIGEFPAFEAYGRADGATSRTILQESPANGSTAWDVPDSRELNTKPVKF